MLINRIKLIGGYDTEVGPIKSHDASAITGMLGEDLAIGCLTKYLVETTGHAAEKVGGTPKMPGRSGKWLDAWVYHTPSTLYQVEVKNWSVHSIGGTPLPEHYDINSPEALKFAQRGWEHFILTEGIQDPNRGISKAWENQMSPPEGYGAHDVQALVVFWQHIFDPTKPPSPMSSFSVKNGPFKKVWLFSISAYLRSLSGDTIDLKLPRFSSRMTALSQLFNPTQVMFTADTSELI